MKQKNEVHTQDGTHYCQQCLDEKSERNVLRPLRNSTTEFNCPFCAKLKKI